MEKKRCYGCMRMKTQSPICEFCGFDETRQNAAHQLPTGTVLREQYMIGRVLGQGGFGITYLGWDLYLDIPVAIKEYYPSGMVMRECGVTNDVVTGTGDVGAAFRNNKERFLREAKMLARFSQVQEIVQVKNFFLANNTAYIVMEYLDGITLKEYVARQGGRLSVEETLGILEPMIRTLHRVHKAGIVHRDISPDNIMMLPDGRAKLLDFGAVRDVGNIQVGQELTKSTEAILKQGYAPIEQYQKRGSLGPWTDVYAMCATIYFCVAGHIPADAPERLLMDEDLDLNIPGLTLQQKKALDHGMALRVEDRTESMEKLYEELTYVAPLPPPGPTPNPRPVPKPDPPFINGNPCPPPPRKKKPFAILAGVLAAVLVCAGIAGLIRPAPDAESSISADQNLPRDQGGTLDSGIQWGFAEESGHLVLSGSGSTGRFSMPQWSDESPVPPWYSLSEQIRSVEIREGLTEIGDNAFIGCVNLESLTLPGSLKRLGFSSFQDTALREVSLPQGLESIEGNAFSGTRLTDVEVPASVTHLGNAFQRCRSLKSVTLLGPTAITGDTWNGSLVNGYGEPVPEGFQLKAESNSGAQAYAKVMGLPFEAIREGSWEEQGTCGPDLQWYLDQNSRTLFIDGTGDMDNYASWGNAPWSQWVREIRTIYLGDGVTGIGNHAFEYCIASDIHFGTGLQRIGDFAFQEACIDEIILPDSVQSVGISAFAGMPWLHYLYIGPDTKLAEEEDTVLTSPLYPLAASHIVVAGVKNTSAQELAEKAHVIFETGKNWNTPWLSGEPTRILPEPRILTGTCGPNAEWEMDEHTGTLTIRGQGPMADYDVPWDPNRVTVAPWYALHDEIRSLRVEDGITHIGSGAFAQCMELSEVRLGNTVESIGTSAFHFVKAREILLPESLKQISAYSFSDARLEQMTIPAGVELLEPAFGSCTELRSLTIQPGTRVLFDAWADNLVNGAPWTKPVRNLTIRGAEGSPAQAYAAMLDVPFEPAFEGSWDREGSCGQSVSWHVDLDTQTMLVDGQGPMEDYETAGEAPWSEYAGQIHHLVIGNQVTHVGSHAFEHSALRHVYFGERIQSVGRYAFAGAQLEHAMLPESLTELGMSAFAGCQPLHRVYLGGACVPEQGDWTPFISPEFPRKPNTILETVDGAPAVAFAEENGMHYLTHGGMFKNWQ